MPTEYSSLNQFISTQSNFFRTLWIPNTTLFGYYSNSHPEISGRDFFREYNQEKLLKKLDNAESFSVLNYAGVKYVIIPSDTEKEIYLNDRHYDKNKYLQVVSSLDTLPQLTKVKQFGDLVVYQINSYKDHFWCDCDSQISYKFINPTHYMVEIKNANKGDLMVFSEAYDKGWIAKSDNINLVSKPYQKQFNSFILPSGNYTLDVYYSPQDLVNIGVKISVVTFIVLIISTALYNIRKRK